MAVLITANAQLNSKKVGPVYIVNNTTGSQMVLSVIETTENDSFHYQLQLNDIKTTRLLKSREIIHAKKQIDQEQIIGKTGDVLWIIADSLAGYNVHTLEIAVTETAIAAVNSFMKNNFSRLHNSYLLDEAEQVMYVSAENGKHYKLYANLTMESDAGNSNESPDDFSYEFAAVYKLYGKYNLKYALSCIDTMNNRLYIMGSTKETTQALSYFDAGIYPERDEQRQLTSIPFNVHEDKIDFSKKKPVTAAQKYYGAAFLQHKFYTTVWHGKNEEHLILYRSGAGNQAKLCIALIDQQGKEKWNCNTGISYLNFTDYLVTENCLVIWMDEYKKTAQLQAAFYIQLNDGKTIKP